MKETIGDIDILAEAEKEEALKVMDCFVSLPDVEQVILKGSTKSSVILREGTAIDLRVVPPESYGAALQYFTGSKEHNIELRNVAIKNGYKLSEYGLYLKESGKQIAGNSEAEIYEKLGLAISHPNFVKTGEKLKPLQEMPCPNW
ncbi:nucleotidyltransferase family protein [Methanosarcina barkeri]|uniref:hypothetical protein n=1 Tax=Methanosarcina barkeri TaxID=2208 RepID=UPI000B17EA3E|nr:hypothetical protein [Methanosarcina barkeri]